VKGSELRELIWQKGRELYRDMPWRRDTRPYYVLVSELMLQQTQVARVIPKFVEFIEVYPDEEALVRASLAEVLRYWQGLGYNRRAKYLHDAAKKIMAEFNGRFPQEAADISSLPGVGKNTLGALRAYAFNEPAVFIETNIRTVFIHHLFSDNFAVDDSQILTALSQVVDEEHPREFYWALMDYGSWLKAHGVKNISQSRHYKKQSPLEGSIRQVRGQIIDCLRRSTLSESELRRLVQADARFKPALDGLKRDGLISTHGNAVQLTK
jgi:A/G-specific adenine glycosylase